MVEPKHKLSVRHQCELLKLCRSGLYYEPESTSEEQLELMKRIDAIHLELPFYGSRKIARALKNEEHNVNRKRVTRVNQVWATDISVP